MSGTRRRSAISPRPTSIAISRSAAGRGVTELGFSEHVYRFREALEVWRHPFWEECAQDGLEEYVDFVESMKARDLPVKLGHRDGLDPGAGRQHRGAAGSVAVGLRRRLGPFPGRRGRGPRRLRRLGLGGPGSGLEHLFRHARRCGGQRPVRHPRAPRPREGLGSWTAGAAAPAARLLRARDRADRRGGRGDRGVDGRACGSRSARSIPPATCSRCSSTRASRLRSRPTPTSPKTIGHGYDAAVALLHDVGVDRICVFDRRARSEEPLG